MDEQIRAYQAAASATLYTGAGRLRGVYAVAAGTAGTLIFKDGGSGGTTILTINTPAAVGAHYHDIPGNGIAFGTDLYVAVTTATAVTAYCGRDLGNG
ncbi:MAG: hypothetical protein O3C57_01280 [Verrucomicrobia bacterium]|nr:hypothetical protein [Verrucomicrobiota bacterium]